MPRPVEPLPRGYFLSGLVSVAISKLLFVNSMYGSARDIYIGERCPDFLWPRYFETMSEN